MTEKSKFRVALESMPKEQWFEKEEIYAYIEKNVELTEYDKEILEEHYVERWKWNLNSMLNKLKKEGWVDHFYRVVKGEVSNKTLPPKYMFNTVPKVDVEVKNDNNRTKYFDAVMMLEKNRWYTLDEIYDHIERLGIVEEGERERSKPDNPMPIWKHRIYTLMSHMKLRGYAEHKKAVAKAKSPTGEKIPAMYMFIK